MKKRNICYTALRRNLWLTFVSVLTVSVSIALFVCMLGVKPALFDENSMAGAPEDIAKENGYTNFRAEGVCDVILCGNPVITGKTAKFYLTNPAQNTVCIRAEIYAADLAYDSAGNITDAKPGKLLGKSGFIRPGEYVEDIVLKKGLKADSVRVMIKIATYDEESGASNGFFYVNTILHP